MVAALAPGARVVKAFNSIVTERFNEGAIKNGGRRRRNPHLRAVGWVRDLEKERFITLDHIVIDNGQGHRLDGFTLEEKDRS